LKILKRCICRYTFFLRERTSAKKETEKSSGERREEGLKKLQKREKGKGKAPILFFIYFYAVSATLKIR